MGIEYEAKFLNIDKDDLRNRLNNSGYKLIKPEVLMRRKTFHFPDNQGNKWGRVRDEGNRITMTVKEITKNNAIDGLLEVELIINDFDSGAEFLKCCGLTETSYQENKREVWGKGSVEICIDEWPKLNPYVEIESLNENEVITAANELGFNYADAVFGGTEIVYEKVIGIPSGDLVKMKKITFEEFC